MNVFIVDYRLGMCGLTYVPVYETNGVEAVNTYHLSNDWNKFKDGLTDLCYAANTFDVIFYGNANTIPYEEKELKQEFSSFEHKKYANAGKLNIRIELC